LNFPPWGGVVNWGGTGQFVLCFQMPSGEWALSDITDGVPWNNQIIPVQQYLQSMPSSMTSAGDVFWNTLPANFMQSTLEFAANVGALAKQTLHGVGGIMQVSAEEIAAILAKLLAGVTPTLSTLLVPVALVAAVVLFTMYGKKST